MPRKTGGKRPASTSASDGRNHLHPLWGGTTHSTRTPGAHGGAFKIPTKASNTNKAPRQTNGVTIEIRSPETQRAGGRKGKAEEMQGRGAVANLRTASASTAFRGGRGSANSASHDNDVHPISRVRSVRASRAGKLSSPMPPRDREIASVRMPGRAGPRWRPRQLPKGLRPSRSTRPRTDGCRPAAAATAMGVHWTPRRRQSKAAGVHRERPCTAGGSRRAGGRGGPLDVRDLVAGPPVNLACAPHTPNSSSCASVALVAASPSLANRARTRTGGPRKRKKNGTQNASRKLEGRV